MRRVAPQHRNRNVTTDDCDVTSPYMQLMLMTVIYGRPM